MESNPPGLAMECIGDASRLPSALSCLRNVDIATQMKAARLSSDVEDRQERLVFLEAAEGALLDSLDTGEGVATAPKKEL